MQIGFYDKLEWYFYNQFFASYDDKTIEEMLKVCEDFQYGRIGLDDKAKEGFSLTVGEFFEEMNIRLIDDEEYEEYDDPLDPYCENFELN